MIIQVLKHTLNNPEWLAKTQPELFKDDYNQIFKIARAMEAKGIKPTFDSLKYSLNKKGYLSAGAELAHVYAAKDIDESTFRVARTDLRTEAQQKLLHSYSALGDLDDKTLKQFSTRLEALSHEDEPEELESAISFSNWNAHSSPSNALIGSGLGFLENTGSDWCRTDLIALLAPSNQGKSTVLAHTVKYLFAEGKNVLVIVFEETPSKYLSRIGMGLLSKTKWQYEQLTPEEKEREITFSYRNLGNLEVIVGSSLYVEDLQSLIKEQEKKIGYEYDAIVIDYSRQLQSRAASKNLKTYEEISVVFRELKRFAMKSNKLVITATQSNREGYGSKDVTATNISESMGPLHNVDMMISLKSKVINATFTDIPFKDERASDAFAIIKMIVLKKREGSVSIGKNSYYFQTKDNNITRARPDEISHIEDNWETDDFNMNPAA